MKHIYNTKKAYYCGKYPKYPYATCGVINIHEATCIKCLNKFINRKKPHKNVFNQLERAKARLSELTFTTDFDKMLNEE